MVNDSDKSQVIYVKIVSGSLMTNYRWVIYVNFIVNKDVNFNKPHSTDKRYCKKEE